MALVYVTREQITACKLVPAMLTLVRPVSCVRTHMSGDMLWPGEGRVADWTFVIARHLDAAALVVVDLEELLERGEQEEW